MIIMVQTILQSTHLTTTNCGASMGKKPFLINLQLSKWLLQYPPEMIHQPQCTHSGCGHWVSYHVQFWPSSTNSSRIDLSRLPSLQYLPKLLPCLWGVLWLQCYQPHSIESLLPTGNGLWTLDPSMSRSMSSSPSLQTLEPVAHMLLALWPLWRPFTRRRSHSLWAYWSLSPLRYSILLHPTSKCLIVSWSVDLSQVDWFSSWRLNSR